MTGRKEGKEGSLGGTETDEQKEGRMNKWTYARMDRLMDG